MVKVLYLEPAGKMWGSERSLLPLLKQGKAQSCDAMVCLPYGAAFLKELKPLGLRVFPWLPADLTNAGGFSKLRALLGLLGAALVSRAQILHLNQAGFVRAAYLVASWLRRPINSASISRRTWMTKGRRVKRWRRVVCIANSRFVASALEKNGVPADRIFQITNPIEGTELMAGKTPRRWQMGFVGRLSKDKGIELFLQACQQAAQIRPTLKAVVVGSSGAKTAEGQDYLEAMQLLANKLGIADNVEFLGYRKDVLELMRQMEVFVMASEAEPWGRVVAEAMMTGATVVATDAGGPREMITHGENGLLVPPGNVTAMAEAVLRLVENPEYAHRLAGAARQWVKRECNTVLHTTRVMQLYQRLLK